MADEPTPWLDRRQACEYAHVGPKLLYRAVAEKRLRAAHVDGRRKRIFRREWLDAWLTATAPTIIELPRRDRGAA
jgi:excisionase family DNA binding protein